MRERLKILENECDELDAGIKKARHEYHSFILSTLRGDSPESRTVILRDFNKTHYSIAFHSDIRSTKINDIKLNNSVSALFYDRSRRMQLRISGKATIEYENTVTKQYWSIMTPESKVCYMGPFRPSKKISSFKPNLPDITPYQINSEYEKLGYSRFCRIIIKMQKLDWLSLHHTGHKRVLFTFNNQIDAEWIAS